MEGKKRKEVKCDETTVSKTCSIDRKLDRRGTASMLYSSLFHLQFDAYQTCCFQFKYVFFVSRGCEHCEPCEPSLVTSAGDLQKGPLCRLHRATVPRQWINWIDFSYVLSCVLAETTKQPCFFLNRRSKHLNFWLH